MIRRLEGIGSPTPREADPRKAVMNQSHFSQVTISVDDSDPREPAARCDQCGKAGTIARATRLSEPPLVLRYCADCWPIVQKELDTRQQEEQASWRHSRGSSPPPPAWTTSSRSWHDVLQFLQLIAQPMRGGRAPTEADLASIASEIRGTMSEMVGDVPPEVEAFLKLYPPPAA
jgi:hypothetical protein